MSSRDKTDGLQDAKGRHRHRHGRGACGLCDEKLLQAAEGGAGMVPLSLLVAGERGRLCCINAGRNLCCRLTSMGLVPGMVVSVVRRQGGGEMVVSAHRTRLALGRGIVEKIMVEPLAGAHETASP